MCVTNAVTGGQQHTWEGEQHTGEAGVLLTSIDTTDADHNGLGRSLDPMPNVVFDGGWGGWRKEKTTAMRRSTQADQTPVRKCETDTSVQQEP